MIERQIKQLHEAGITDITIIVGYLKEKFEYLIDKYQVKLLYNPVEKISEPFAVPDASSRPSPHYSAFFARFFGTLFVYL